MPHVVSTEILKVGYLHRDFPGRPAIIDPAAELICKEINTMGLM